MTELYIYQMRDPCVFHVAVGVATGRVIGPDACVTRAIALVTTGITTTLDQHLCQGSPNVPVRHV